MPGMIIKLNKKKNRKPKYFLCFIQIFINVNVLHIALFHYHVFLAASISALLFAIHQYLGKCTLIYVF